MSNYRPIMFDRAAFCRRLKASIEEQRTHQAIHIARANGEILKARAILARHFDTKKVVGA